MYVPLDVNYLDDPKVEKVSAWAELLYVRALATMRRRNTNGALSLTGVRQLMRGMRAPVRLANELEAAGLWEATADGWRVPPKVWRKYNPTADQVANLRELRRMQGVQGAHNRWHGENPNPLCELCTMPNAIANAIGLPIGSANGYANSDKDKDKDKELLVTSAAAETVSAPPEAAAAEVLELAMKVRIAQTGQRAHSPRILARAIRAGLWIEQGAHITQLLNDGLTAAEIAATITGSSLADVLAVEGLGL